MMPTGQGSFRLFRFAGIDVFLHWSWFVVAVFMIQYRRGDYSSLLWNGLEYVGLFAIVLLHEFGHSLACRQVGGKANQIVLWPLGGVAYVAPPPRPGATLWSIAAGPLVNVALAPILTGLLFLAGNWGWNATLPDAYELIRALWIINTGILIFNLLPIYPLDGGQILQSVLWFFMSRARSLMVASIIGIIGVVALIGLAVLDRSIWIVLIAVFILMNCWQGLRQAQLLSRVAKLPRRGGFACPECKQPPVSGPYWRCQKCLQPFDMFASLGTCPHCGTQFETTLCLDCGNMTPIARWMVAPPVLPRD
ncbi:MAG TPA: site-2 protease family protein [Clostridia bacterium]|nr:site-2 protease family protein [Clostridia bacterium]